MNIFEGSRRISYVVAVLGVLLALSIAILKEPYVSIKYFVNSPISNPERIITGECPDNGKWLFFTKRIDESGNYNVSLCLLPLRFGEDRRFLIPYKVDDQGFWGAEKYSPEVLDYERKLEDKFSFSKEDIDWIKAQESKIYWDNIKETLFGIVISLLVFFAFTWILGWIVRGFMGIPKGMDRKPDI